MNIIAVTSLSEEWQITLTRLPKGFLLNHTGTALHLSPVTIDNITKPINIATADYILKSLAARVRFNHQQYFVLIDSKPTYNGNPISADALQMLSNLL